MFVVALVVCRATVADARSFDPDSRQHTVRYAETLSAIAQQNGVSVAALRRWNGIRDDRILVGQKITVWRATEPQGYTVRRGDNLSEIAHRFGVSVAALKKQNKLSGHRIDPGQRLRLRAAPPAKRAPTGVHVVKRGDTLSDIAFDHGLGLRHLRELNKLNGDNIRVGQHVRLRAPAPSAVAAAPQASQRSGSPEQREYKVRPGDTLSHIARRFDVGLDFLRQLNDLPNDRIHPGQKLRLRPSRADEGIHIVRYGETLSEIAERYRLELAQLKELNGIDGDRIVSGQKLRLKAIPAAVHIVERGDALWEIARAYGMKVSELKKNNGLTSDRIYPGQELKLSLEKSRQLAVYTVRGGDNLSEIARLHQMSVAELKRLNQLQSAVIHPGQQLSVRPLFSRRAHLDLADVDWAAFLTPPGGVRRIDAENGPYFSLRPKADQQRRVDYYEGHPASPLKTYRQARTLWQHFERAVSQAGRVSDRLEGWHVVLDPGHGGLDPGAVRRTTDGNGRQLFVVEDEYVYDIALRTYVLLRLHGATASMTVLSPNHLIRQTTPPARTFVNEKNEVYNSYGYNKGDTRNQWPRGSRNGLNARVRIAREAFAGIPRARRIFLSFHADSDLNSPEAPLVLYYESRDGRRSDRTSRRFARALLPAMGAGARTRGQALGVLRDNPAAVKVLVELRNLAYVDHAWALRFEQLRHRDAEKVVKGVLDYAQQQPRTAGR